MAKNNNLKDFLTDLANKFRAYDTVFPPSRPINPQEFSSLVDATRDYGFEKGYNEGIVTGTQQGYSSGYEEGKQDEYDAFWDVYQENGQRTNYVFAFVGDGNSGWNNATFKPKYDLKPTRASYMFRGCKIVGDFDEILTKLGVSLDTSSLTNYGDNMFYYASKITGITVDFSKLSAATDTFNGCAALSRLVIVVNENMSYTRTFDACKALTDLTIIGTIGNSVDFRYSPLSKSSIENVIACLSDTATGKTLSISKTAKETAFTEEEWQTLIATKSNWTIALA